MSEEVWKPIKGYEGIYEVSSYGRVRSLTRYITIQDPRGSYMRKLHGRIMTPHKMTNGYLVIRLSQDCEEANCLIHRLVALAFVSGYRDGLIINHKDRDKTNNKADNLEWVTYQENNRYMDAHIKRAQERHKKFMLQQMLHPKPPKPKVSREVHARHISENNAKNMAVLQYDKDGNFIAEYRSQNEAARNVGLKSGSSITMVLSGMKKTAAGYYWKKKETE